MTPRRRFSKKRKVRLGFIGAGWWSTTYYLPVLQRRPDVELVSICGLDREVLKRCQRDFGFTHSTSDYHELLQQDLDGVVIGSPHSLHAEHALAAVAAGCHVMVEKPFTTSAVSARKLVALARARRKIILVPCGWQFRPIGTEAKRLMDKGVVGRVEFVQCHMASQLKNLFSGNAFDFRKGAYVPANLSTWADPRRSHGGYGQGQLPHSIGLMLWLTGLKPATVFARMTQPGSRVDMYDALSVAYKGGAIGSVTGAATLPPGTPGDFQLEIRIFGDKGTLHLDVSRDHLSWQRHGGKHHIVPLEKGAGTYVCEEPPHRFVELILGLTDANNSPGEIALGAVELLDAAYRSAHSNQNERI